MLYKSRLLWAKIESTYGTDPTPTNADTILTQGLTISPYQGNTVSRDYDSPALGNSEIINTGPYAEVQFNVELAGSGAAGDAPGYGVLLKACGFSETLTASTDAVYAPISSAFPSVTLYFNVDGQRHILKGARGTVGITMSRGQLPTLNFTFTGLYATPTESAMTADFSAFVAPIAVTDANTGTYTLHGYAAKAESFTMSMNNNVVYRNVVNGESVIITDRSPSGQFAIEAPTLSAKNYFSAIESHSGVTTGALQIIHGATSGNIIQVDAPAVQLSSLTMNDSDGILVYQMDAQFIPTSAGNDEFVLTVK